MVYMKIIDAPIDENEYNPQQSIKVGDWNPAELSGGFCNGTETLYKNGNGNYFILIQGGLFSRNYTSPDSEVWYGGTSIRPVTEQQAFAWCQETGNYEAIDKYFFLLKIIS